MTDAGATRTILVVDDNSAVRGFVKAVLISAGYQVIEAENGEEALGICRDGHSIDLVLTDLAMPVMDGPRLIAGIALVRPRCKVIAMSGSPRKLKTINDVPYLKKPFTGEQLLQKIREVILRSGRMPPRI
jgi:two-component system cell cycle sensor histidine kinase/response regulator CckA